MSLSVVVGILDGLDASDPAAAAYWREALAAANRATARAGVPTHEEPGRVAARLELEIPSYADIHLLRRVAAHVAAGRALGWLKPPLDRADRVVQAYYRRVTASLESWTEPLPFEHVMVHGDAEGFYLPIDFPKAAFAEDDDDVPGHMVGSSPRLLDECRTLAGALAGAPQHRAAAHACAVLAEAAERSVATGAAVVFS